MFTLLTEQEIMECIPALRFSEAENRYKRNPYQKHVLLYAILFT